MSILRILSLFSLIQLSVVADAKPPKKEPTAEEKKLQANLKKYLSDLEEKPKHALTLYNLGLTYYLLEDFKLAQKHWEKLVELYPKDWQTRKKLIQVYEALYLTVKRDEEIKTLKTMRASGKFAALSAKPFYIRDQFNVGDKKVYTLEYYKLEGKRAYQWKFLIYDKGKADSYFLSLGSMDTTTEIGREMGDIGKDDRFYHLDAYFNNGGHATHGFFKNLPDYNVVKKKVTAIIEGKTKPLSSSGPASPKKEKSPK